MHSDANHSDNLNDKLLDPKERSSYQLILLNQGD